MSPAAAVNLHRNITTKVPPVRATTRFIYLRIICLPPLPPLQYYTYRFLISVAAALRMASGARTASGGRTSFHTSLSTSSCEVILLAFLRWSTRHPEQHLFWRTAGCLSRGTCPLLVPLCWWCRSKYGRFISYCSVNTVSFHEIHSLVLDSERVL